MSCSAPSGLPMFGCCGGDPIPSALSSSVKIVASLVGYSNGVDFETIYRTVSQTIYVARGGPSEGVAHVTMSVDDNGVETLDHYDEDAKFTFGMQHGFTVDRDPATFSGSKLSKVASAAVVDAVLASIPYPPKATQAGQLASIKTGGVYYFGSRGLEVTTGIGIDEQAIAYFVPGIPDLVPFIQFAGPWPGTWTSRIGAGYAWNHIRGKSWYWSASSETNLECQVVFGGNPYSEICEGVNLGPLDFNHTVGREVPCQSDQLNLGLPFGDLWTRKLRPRNQLTIYPCCFP